MAEGTARSVSATYLYRSIGTVMDEVAVGKATVIVTSHGRPQVAIVPVEEYDALVEARRQLAWTRLARLTDEPAKTEA